MYSIQDQPGSLDISAPAHLDIRAFQVQFKKKALKHVWSSLDQSMEQWKGRSF